MHTQSNEQETAVGTLKIEQDNYDVHIVVEPTSESANSVDPATVRVTIAIGEADSPKLLRFRGLDFPGIDWTHKVDQQLLAQAERVARDEIELLIREAQVGAEIIDGFIVSRTWTQIGNDYYPVIMVEKRMRADEYLRNFRRINNAYATKQLAEAEAKTIKVVGIRIDGTAVIIEIE